MNRCIAYHDGHDCSAPGACTRAIAAMLDRADAQRAAEDARRRDDLAERQHARTVPLLWPDDPNWVVPRIAGHPVQDMVQ